MGGEALVYKSAACLCCDRRIRMTLASIRDALQRRLEYLDCEEDEVDNSIVFTHEVSNCPVCVKLREEMVVVIIDEDDAMQIAYPLGRMSVSSSPLALRARDSNGAYFTVRVSSAGRGRDGTKLVKYETPAPPSNMELDRIVMLIVAVFKKAAGRYRAA